MMYATWARTGNMMDIFPNNNLTGCKKIFPMYQRTTWLSFVCTSRCIVVLRIMNSYIPCWKTELSISCRGIRIIIKMLSGEIFTNITMAQSVVHGGQDLYVVTEHPAVMVCIK